MPDAEKKPKPTEFVTWTKVLSQTMCLGPVPVRACLLWYDREEDEVSAEELTILGISSTIAEDYSRKRRGAGDVGTPHDGPSEKSLHTASYFYEGRGAELDYIVHHQEYESPATLSSIRNEWSRSPEAALVVGLADGFDALKLEEMTSLRNRFNPPE